VTVARVQGDLQRALGENLRTLRVGRGMSQEDFAEFLGVHRTYMGGVERGERNLTLRSVEKLAERLDVDPVSLLRPPPS
jgi:transcriptional regulator with XRE-family HTH domain